MPEKIEIDRRQYSRRQCDQHDLCVQQVNTELEKINRKIDILCKRSETQILTAERVKDLEHRIGNHQEKIDDERKWRNGHEKFKDCSLKEQQKKDDAMQADITGLKLAISELTTTIVSTEARAKEYVRKPLLAMAGVAVVTCLGAVGALAMAIVNFVLLKAV